VTGTGAGKAGRVRPRTRLALRPLRRVTIAHADALAHHEEEAKEDEAADDDEGKTNQEKAAAEEVKVEEGDAEWDADDDEGKAPAAPLRPPSSPISPFAHKLSLFGPKKAQNGDFPKVVAAAHNAHCAALCNARLPPIPENAGKRPFGGHFDATPPL
jgi:hypothetical protein